MSDERYQQLVRKRDSTGLTDEEADELGKMIAEREGVPYSNASGQAHPESETEEGQPYSEAEMQELQQHPEVRDTPEGSEKAS